MLCLPLVFDIPVNWNPEAVQVVKIDALGHLPLTSIAHDLQILFLEVVVVLFVENHEFLGHLAVVHHLLQVDSGSANDVV